MILKEYSMETKAINWERGSVYINESYSTKGADPNSGPHKLRSPQEQYTKFKRLLQPRLSLVPNVIWTKLAHIFWLETIPGSHHWVRCPHPCSGESTFAVPLAWTAWVSVLPACSKTALLPQPTLVKWRWPWDAPPDCSVAPNQGTNGDSQMERRTPQGQQIPKARSSGGTLALGWFIWFGGRQLFLQFINNCRL